MNDEIEMKVTIAVIITPYVNPDLDSLVGSPSKPL